MAKDFNTLQNNINLKSDKTHNHDNRYFTETEVNNKLANHANIKGGVGGHIPSGGASV